MGLVQSLCSFLSSLRLLCKQTPKALSQARQPEPVTALPLFNGQMVLYAYADGQVLGTDVERRVLFRESIPKERLTLQLMPVGG